MRKYRLYGLTGISLQWLGVETSSKNEVLDYVEEKENYPNFRNFNNLMLLEVDKRGQTNIVMIIKLGEKQGAYYSFNID